MIDEGVTDARLIFYFLHPLSLPAAPRSSCRFLLLCGYTIAGSCLCLASPTEGNFCLASNLGFCRYWFLERYLPFFRVAPSPCTYPSRSRSLHQAQRRWFIIRVRRPARGVDRFHWIPMAAKPNRFLAHLFLPAITCPYLLISKKSRTYTYSQLEQWH